MSTLVLAAALEVNERDTGQIGKLVSIDPYWQATADHQLPEGCQRIAAEVQTMPLDRLTSLGAGDILFIDSSHVVRTGGDVNFLYLDVLPELAPGVVVHIHDIQIPYEYHRSYSATSHAARLYWTEQYLLQAFLAFNTDFAVLLAGYWLQREHPQHFATLFPTWRADTHRPTTSFYMRRL